MDLIDGGFARLGPIGCKPFYEGLLLDLLVDGVIARLAMLVFLPQILLTFYRALGDSGYMARAAFCLTD